jgi:cytochrome c oxidase assembly protein subunit 15
MNAQKSWLITVNILIAAIVVVGGITRLTDSGLSMVQWQPIHGILPPMTAEEWSEVFNLYRQSPEYLKLNAGMSLDAFKKIFFWEYIHRILGRLIGLAILVPYLIFLLKKSLSSEMKARGAVILTLVILQGLVGWFMVKSGLVNNPDVSHYRLALHLGLAFFLFQYNLWCILDLHHPKALTFKHPLRSAFLTVMFLLVIQIIYGAFVAGLKAGYGFNTWPKMGADWIPVTAFTLKPFLANIIENRVMIQFIHRTLGLLLLFYVIQFVIQSKRFDIKRIPKKWIQIFLITIVLQVIIGIKTLLLIIPLPLALLHQFGALVCLSAGTIVVFHLTKVVTDPKSV